MSASERNLPDDAIDAAAIADAYAKRFEEGGGDIHTLFSAFVGLVSARDKKVGADCLIALDEFFSTQDPGRVR